MLEDGNFARCAGLDVKRSRRITEYKLQHISHSKKARFGIRIDREIWIKTYFTGGKIQIGLNECEFGVIDQGSTVK